MQTGAVRGCRCADNKVGGVGTHAPGAELSTIRIGNVFFILNSQLLAWNGAGSITTPAVVSNMKLAELGKELQAGGTIGGRAGRIFYGHAFVLRVQTA